ncbi:MAG: hypothetical protein ABW185_07010 [Sedimenticola sp.]
MFKSFGLTGDDAKNFDMVLDKFDGHFIPKRNIIHERAKFHQRHQHKGEPVEAFVRNLYELAEHCDFKDTKPEQIRDRIVIGLLDKELSEKLQLKPDLDLDTAIALSRQTEMVKGQIKDQANQDIDEIKAGARPKLPTTAWRSQQNRPGNLRSKPPAKPWQSEKPPPFNRERQCSRCNRRHEKRHTCPAMGQRCRACKKMKNFAACCRSQGQGLREVVEYDDDDYDAYDDENTDSATGGNNHFVGSVDCDTCEEDPWNVDLKICNTTVTFKIDTGADTSIISEATYTNLKVRPCLRPAASILHSPGGRLNSKGYFIAQITLNNGKRCMFRVFVVAGSNQNNLLSRGAASSLNLVQRVEEIKHDVFGHIGLVNCEPVKIRLNEGVTPYSISTARRFRFLTKFAKNLIEWSMMGS